jgi:acid phosphatase
MNRRCAAWITLPLGTGSGGGYRRSLAMLAEVGVEFTELTGEMVMRSMRRWQPSFVLLACTACGTIVHAAPPLDPALTHDIPPFTIPPVVPGAVYERFIVIGDMGTGRPDQYKVAAAMAQRAKSDHVDFILTVGDNIYENGISSVDDPQWKSKFEDVYADPALQLPIYPSLGNHDHRGNPQAQIEYSQRNKNWKMPALYYTFTRTLGDETTVQYFAIDSDPIQQSLGGSREQLTWLDAELGKSNARWKIVFGHHTLYSHVGEDRAEERKIMIAALEPLFTKHKVDVYLAGHDHTLEMLKPIKGVNYVITGGGAGPDKAYEVTWTDEAFYAATLGGFTLLRVGKNEIVIEFVRLDGKTQYAHTITK